MDTENPSEFVGPGAGKLETIPGVFSIIPGIRRIPHCAGGSNVPSY
jgi:hypothetical protein